MHTPPHPGKALKDFLDSVSVTGAAKHLGVTRVALSRVINGSAAISPEMALRLADAFGTSTEFWAWMQADYDIWKAAQRHRKLPRLKR